MGKEAMTGDNNNSYTGDPNEEGRAWLIMIGYQQTRDALTIMMTIWLNNIDSASMGSKDEWAMAIAIGIEIPNKLDHFLVEYEKDKAMHKVAIKEYARTWMC